MKETTAVTNHAKIVMVIIAKVQPNLNWRCIQLLRQEVRNVSVHVEIRNDIARNLTSYCSLLKKAGTSPVKILKDFGADASKSSVEFELKVFLPSPTTGKVRYVSWEMRRRRQRQRHRNWRILTFFAVQFNEKIKKRRTNNCKAALTQPEVNDPATSGFFLLRLVTSVDTFSRGKQLSFLFFFVEVEYKTAGDNSSVASLKEAHNSFRSRF